MNRPSSGPESNPLPHQSAMQDLVILNQVRHGLARREFTLHFQPIWHTGSASVTCIECLLRWHHPVHGTLSPGAFHQAFSDEELSRDIFYFVLDSACREISSLPLQRHASSPRVAINIDVSALTDERLCERIAEITATHDVDPGIIDLEIVETDDSSALLSSRDITSPLKSLGIRLICDDFGIAYPPLSTLSAMRIDGIKFAMDFIRDVPTNERSCTVLKSLLEMCAKLGLGAVVEGIENRAQFDWLSAHGSVEVQGFYVCRPKPKLIEAKDHQFERHT